MSVEMTLEAYKEALQVARLEVARVIECHAGMTVTVACKRVAEIHHVCPRDLFEEVTGEIV